MTCLRSLFQTGAEANKAGRLEVLVQDDASPAFSAAELIIPPVSLGVNPANYGFAANVNAGALRARGDILLILNQDTRAHPGWFEPLMALFDNPAVGIVGPKLVFPEGGIQSCGGLFDGGKGPFHRYIGWDAEDWRCNICEQVSWVTGAALAIRRELFYRIGGFDPAYAPAYFEDVDACMKAKAAGFEIYYQPAAVFTHSVGSTGGIPPYLFRNNSLLFHKRWDAHIQPDTPVRHVDY